MNYSNHNFTPALTVRGVISKCAQEKHAGRKIAHCITAGLTVVMIMAMLAGLLFLIANQKEFENRFIVIPGNAAPTKEQVSSAHRHHGIIASRFDPQTGESYFYRSGKKCQLFAYLQKEGRNNGNRP